MNARRSSTPVRNPNTAPDTPPPQRPRISARTWWITLGIVFLFNLVFYYAQLSQTTSTQGAQTGISYSTFVSQVQANNITTANITGTSVDGNFKKPYISSGKSYTRYTTTVPSEVLNSATSLLTKHGVTTNFKSQQTPAWLTLVSILLQALPFLFLIALFWFGSRAARQQQQGVFGFGQSRAKVYTAERPSTTFADVAGVESAKRELVEVVDFLKDPTKYHSLGARIPKGVLLVGPPGTGKTLLARAVAGEARVPFFSISSTEFVELFVGVGASRVRDLFDRAVAAAPSIVFIDEIDAIGGRRGGRGPLGATNDERESTLNQLLVSMDGFEPNQAVIVLAATNRPDVLDPALLRPGRFDRQVTLDPPDRRGREAILRIHTRQMPLAPNVDLGALGQATPGMSGADLANVANEAALNAARKGESQVTQADFDEALDRITLGAPGSALMNEDERRTVAYHEGGHALVAFVLPNVDPVHRVTITPRGRSLGVTQFRPEDDRRNYRRDYLLSRMAVGLGGRTAEELARNDITSGAQNDIQQVTRMARAMVTQLGMSDELGPEYFGGSSDDALGGRLANPWEPKEYSEETARRIDEAVARLIDEAHLTARKVLSENRAALDAIAQALIVDESLDRAQLTSIINTHLAPGQEPFAVPTGPPTEEVAAAVGEQPVTTGQ
ncbi:MAG: ATP-dependent zinc metalloprotease FtsH [Chloroflexi bacterium]|nr:ATP-dependent zinc metalloprotease FtsH [Chloroflexota bacterium]